MPRESSKPIPRYPLTVQDVARQKNPFRSETPLLVALLLVLSGCFYASAQRPLGCDVSGYQPAYIDWAPAVNNGVRFAWSKATEGTGYVNPNLGGQVTGAVNANVYIGLYHYARPGLHPNLTGTNSADSEAAYFWSVASPYIKYGGYLMPMLDWEDVGNGTTTDPTVANGFTTAQMSAWVNEWCTSLSNTAYASGVVINPVVYTGTWYSTPGSTYPGLNSSVTYHPNNMSGYPTTPNPQTGAPSTTPWTTWSFWQYADTNWTGGDSDVYNGDLNGLIRNFVIGGTNAPLFTLPPTNTAATPGAGATFYTKVSGLRPMSLTWYFNGAVLPGATSSNLTVANIQASQAGAYSIVASNSYARITNTVYLTLLTNAPGSLVAPSGLVNWWTGDGTPADIVGNTVSTPAGGLSYVSGYPGRAFHFDGSTSYLSTSTSSRAVPWTLCFWVNRQNAPGTAAALCGDGDSEVKLEQYNTARQVGFTIFTVADYTFGYSVPLNTWTHLAIVASGTGASAQMQLYANGSPVGMAIATNGPCPRAYFGAGYISANHTSNPRVLDYMLGSVDELMVFNRALSAAEISTLAAAGRAGIVRAPEITQGQKVSSTQYQLSLRGLTGRNFTIYRSFDLQNWLSLGSVANPSGTLQYVTGFATNDIQFYRVSQP